MGARCAAALLCAALMTFGLTGTAAGSEFDQFANCPTANPATFKCVHTVATGGEVVLGRKTVPLAGEMVLQGGVSKPVAGVSKFIAASNGQTLVGVPLPVFHNHLIDVSVSVELARPASEIQVSEIALLSEEGAALTLPVKFHLKSRLLGGNCYIGSSSTPILWRLTTGTTSPPPPNVPLTGALGEIELKEEARILQLNSGRLVDNAWSAPGASGCGRFLSFLVNPFVDALVGLPAPAGRNTTILEGITTDIATAAAVVANP